MPLDRPLDRTGLITLPAAVINPPCLAGEITRIWRFGPAGLKQRRLIKTKRPAPAPLPVTIEPSAPEPTPEAAADAAALLELAGGDEATLAALRALLLVPGG